MERLSRRCAGLRGVLKKVRKMPYYIKCFEIDYPAKLAVEIAIGVVPGINLIEMTAHL